MEDWRNWCRLCAKTDAKYINALPGVCVPTMMSSVNVYTSMNIACIIAEFFRIHIKEDEKLSTWICRECCETVQSLVEFNENIKNVQNFYNDLLASEDKTKLDLKALYEKYGLSKEENLASEEHTKLPVEEIFIVKSESTSNALTVEAPIKEFDIVCAYKDPIGEEKPLAGKESCFSLEESDTCSSARVDNVMAVDAAEETDDDDEQTSNKIKGENIISTAHGAAITRVSKYICSICAQRFQRSGNYAAHMIKKHDKIICPDCPGLFENEVCLKRHMKEQHRKLYPCKQCERKFQRKEYVEQHIKFVHNDERPFICEACGDAVRTKGQLKEHMLTHTDYSPFECKECGKCFKQKQRLKRHMQIHGEKLICNDCGKQLSCRATYNNHMLVHSDKMHHKCDCCGREFKRAKTLKSHLILHSGLKPYSCEFCDRIFTNGSNCRTHMKRTHPRELAELEASGEKTYTKNIPELAVLKSVVRRAENLVPVVSKQSGNFAFGRKIKSKTNSHDGGKQIETKL